MAILCGRWSDVDLCVDVLAQRGLPHQVRKENDQFDPGHDSIKAMTMHVSKDLECPMVVMVGVDHMPADGENEREEARLFYVRATRRLLIGASGRGAFAARI